MKTIPREHKMKTTTRFREYDVITRRLNEYTLEKLEKKTTSELEWYYMEAFKDVRELGIPDSSPRLEIITDVLFRRNDHREKRTIHAQINMQLSQAVQAEEYEKAAVFRDMLAHYEQHIMG